MTVPLAPIILLFVSWALSAVIFIFGVIILGLLTRLRIEVVALFFGPALIRFRFRDTQFRLNAIPIGAYVTFANGEADVPNAPEAHRGLDALSPLARIALNLIGPLGLLGFCCILLGPSRAIDAYLSGFAQILHGGLHPLLYASRQIRNSLLDSSPFLIKLGIHGAKFAALDSLPLPAITSGGALLLEPLRAVYPPVGQQPLYTQIGLPSLAAMTIIAASWLIGLIHAVSM